MNDTYLLSADETRIVTDTEWIFAKHRIIGKVYLLFGELSRHYGSVLQTHGGLPHEVTAVSAKIYKGENYLMLPYVMLDHPRYFNRTDAFAIRTLFWWGNSFSIHLVLGGKYKTALMRSVENNIRMLDPGTWHFSFTDDPWNHHFQHPNYQALATTRLDGPTTNYFKLGCQLPLDQWEGARTFFTTSFDQLIGLFR